MIDDFFTGEGARGDALRTIFTVGDYKQAIFGFQGTSPENFARAKVKVRSQIEAARAHAHEMRDNRRLPTWNDLDLGRSFRTSKPVLDFVNAAIETIGHDAFGLVDRPEPHIGAVRAGMVTLWDPVSAEAEDEDEDQDWLPAHDTLLADKIAEQVRRWISDEEPVVLEKGRKRHARAGDIMVLVRKRKQLASQIVAKLHAKGVPVAGVDRLRLGAPLAVRDLVAALRFAAQPLDDLSLANLLASPLIGWTQDDLLTHAPRARGTRLWDHLRKHETEFVAATAQKLRDLLALADFETPQSMLAWLLTGPWQGRAKLIARLGREASDPIDELVNAAFAFEASHTPSLAGFLEWFDAGDGELKRDADEADGLVRVMTVHGSKGLQAPIVILADAAGESGSGSELALVEDPVGANDDVAKSRQVPLPPLSKNAQVGPVKAANELAALAETEEHWRLLYVAITRAEEALFIGGSLNSRQQKNGVPDESWYAHLAPLFEGEPIADDIWGERREWGERAEPIFDADQDDQSAVEGDDLPAWVSKPIGAEPQPPKPLAPSKAGEDQSPDPPLSPQAAQHAARRGVLIHRLLERLPIVTEAQRTDTAGAWLERQAHDLPQEMRDEMVESALAVLDHPAFAPVFMPQALAEVPIAARVGGVVIAGTIDRLLIGDDAIMAVDFKTSRRPPRSLEDIHRSTLRQMAAYASALEAIYPGRPIKAAVLYTHTPQMFEIPSETLALHKDRLGEAQESFVPDHIE